MKKLKIMEIEVQEDAEDKARQIWGKVVEIETEEGVTFPDYEPNRRLAVHMLTRKDRALMALGSPAGSMSMLVVGVLVSLVVMLI